MSTTWYDLSNEIRKIIIEYAVADKTVTFLPRHAATRGSREKDGAKTQEPAHFPLLLVSKQFLTYAELNDAVLKNATIKYNRGRDLAAIDGRFGKGGIESIRRLYLSFSMKIWGHLSLLPLQTPSKLQKRLTGLQTMTMHVQNLRAWIDNIPNPIDLIAIAKGQPMISRSYMFPFDPTERLRKRLQSILQDIIDRALYKKISMWLLKFLRETPGLSFERIIEFDIIAADSDVYAPYHARYGNFIEPIEFSTASQCCRLLNHPSVVMPQRLDQYLVNSHPWLKGINEVELDKYHEN